LGADQAGGKESRTVISFRRRPETVAFVAAGAPDSIESLSVGFEWENFDQILEKLDEEFYELRHAYKQGDIEDIEEEFGDLLFVLVSISRFLKINPDDALQKAIKKFTTRFTRMEQKMKAIGKEWKNMTGAEMDQLWNEAKGQ